MLLDIQSIATHVTFIYNNTECGIDPLAIDKFNMWYGDITYTANSYQDVIGIKLFDGKNLLEIRSSIESIE